MENISVGQEATLHGEVLSNIIIVKVNAGVVLIEGSSSTMVQKLL